MNCSNDNNIGMLENVISRCDNPDIFILPAVIKDDSEIKINKINTKEAYEIGKRDIEACTILKDDNPIIPNDIKNAPVIELLKINKPIVLL